MSAEKKFKAGDKVRVVRETTSYGGETYLPGRTARVIHRGLAERYETNVEFDGQGQGRHIRSADLELVTEAQTIEVGDTVKATHIDGTTVQGVAEYAKGGNVDITLPGTSGAASLYENEGWAFEGVSKAVKPPKVGDPWREGLPVGTVVEFGDKSATLFLTSKGWVMDGSGGVLYPEDCMIGPATIVYLPGSAND